jgi:hypothetical protein
VTAQELPAREVVQVEGHIIDSLILAKILDVILAAGGDYRMLDVDIGLPLGRCFARPALPPDRQALMLDDGEALAFCANSVVVGRAVVMPTCPPRVGRALENWGFEPVECEVSEFLEAGGGCRCPTLALDVELGWAT